MLLIFKALSINQTITHFTFDCPEFSHDEIYLDKFKELFAENYSIVSGSVAPLGDCCSTIIERNRWQKKQMRFKKVKVAEIEAVVEDAEKEEEDKESIVEIGRKRKEEFEDPPCNKKGKY